MFAAPPPVERGLWRLSPLKCRERVWRVYRQFARTIRLCFALAVLVGLAPLAAAATVHRIIAIGDLHGDDAAWRQIAAAAKLIDPQGHWTGGSTVLVQVGDVVDRGPRSLDIIHDLMRLQREAPRAGGRVVALVGNHEAMNMTSDLRYVSAGDYAAFVTPGSARLRDEVYAANKDRIEAAYRKVRPKLDSDTIRRTWMAGVPMGQIEHQRAWGPEGAIGRWVISNPAVVLLDGVLFVHGGISAAYSRLSLLEINRRVAAALTKQDESPEAIINDPAGPLWYRGYAVNRGAADAAPDEQVRARNATAAQAPVLSVEDELDTVLKAYGASRMVIGHTPILSGIATLYGGKLIRIDTGISAVYGGKLGFLEIIDGQPIAREVARSSSPQ